MPRTGIPTYLFPMAAPKSPRAVAQLAVAVVRAFLLLLRLRPRVTFATGGYVSIPGVVASWAARIPIVMFLPDVVPGRAVAWLVPLCSRVAVSTDDALRHLPASKTVVTGYPVREGFLETSRACARQRLGLPSDARVLCVFGGSQGARSINQALAAWLPELLASMHVVHVAGERRLPEAEHAAEVLDDEQRKRYFLYPYLHDEDMANALAAADLVLCRSGASTIGELTCLGVPAILVPLPEPAVHQYENAEYLEQHGAAVIVENDDLPGELGPRALTLMNDSARLATMTAASSALARPDAAAAIAEEIAAVAK